MGNPIFKYEKFELLVCIYEYSRALIFKYGISGCSRCLDIGNYSESYTIPISDEIVIPNPTK